MRDLFHFEYLERRALPFLDPQGCGEDNVVAPHVLDEALRVLETSRESRSALLAC